jgi:hypothetical protein
VGEGVITNQIYNNIITFLAILKWSAKLLGSPTNYDPNEGPTKNSMSQINLVSLYLIFLFYL